MSVEKYERQPYTFDRVVRILFTVCAILAVIYLLNVLKGVLFERDEGRGTRDEASLVIKE